MSEINCSACSDLRDTSTEFIVNGTTETVCTSLQNNTGINPNLTVLHDNDRDLNDMNDCFVGIAASEVESYEVCDWKTFMKRLLGNLYEFFKAILCSLKGIWNNIERLWTKVNCLVKAMNKLVAAIDDSVGAETFVRYYRDNSDVTSGYEWSGAMGSDHTLDIYMNASGDNAGNKAADRDYVVMCTNCTDLYNFNILGIYITYYSSGDTRDINTIRLKQAMHPAYNAGTGNVIPNYSWNLTSPVVIRKGEHIKLNAHVYESSGGTPQFRVHQVAMTWIPIAPSGGIDVSGITDC